MEDWQMTDNRREKLNAAVDNLKEVINADDVTFEDVQTAIDEVELQFNTNKQ